MHLALHPRRLATFLVGILCLTGLSTAGAGGIRVLPLGDSITSGSNGHASYRRELWRRLVDAGYPVDFVGTLSGVYNGTPPTTDYDLDHEGHSGWRTDEIAALVSDWAEATRPDVVLIHVGSNDVAQLRSPAEIIENTGLIIDEIRSVEPQVAILLACIIPSAHHGQWDSVAVVNTLIPDLAREKNTPASPVFLVDQTRGFDPLLHTYDKIHPNETGEAIMAGNWFGPLAAHLDALPPRASFRVVNELPSVGDPIAFDASASFVPGAGRTVREFAWSFDDGSESGESVTHAFLEPGPHTVSLTVTDDRGRTATASGTVYVLGPLPVRETTWGRLKSRYGS